MSSPADERNIERPTLSPSTGDLLSLTRGDLVEANPVPAVVCLEEMQDLLASLIAPVASRVDKSKRVGLLTGVMDPETRTRLADYVENYFVAEDENRRALSSVLTSLAGPGESAGRGFILNGLYGSGKSHFLAVVGLLSGCPAAWPLFLHSHPEYRSLSPLDRDPKEAEVTLPDTGQQSRQPLLVVTVPLDAHRGATEDLEDIVFEAAERVLDCLGDEGKSGLSAGAFALCLAEERLFPLYRDQFNTWLGERLGPAADWDSLCATGPAEAAGLAAEFAAVAGVPLSWEEPRRERLHRLMESAARCRRRGVLILLDELSLFLSSKTRDRFYNDISFLQFLGQRSRFCPLWIVAAVQRGIEEVGDIDPDVLHKLKDRYIWDLTLSMAQLRPVLGRRVVRKKDPDRFRQVMESLWDEQSSGGCSPGLDPEDLANIYPLHPAALECLSEASNRFFSKTRSVIQFVVQVVNEGRNRPAGELVGPDQVFDYFRFAVAENPELRPTHDACAYYASQAAEIHPEDPAYALRLVHALAAMAIAGLRKPVRDLAAAVPPPVDLGPASRLALAQSVLERLRIQGGYVDVSRGGEAAADVYYFDAGYDMARTVRRRLSAYVADLSPDDSRVLACAFSAASDSGLPLEALARPCRVEVDWVTVRHVAVVQRMDLRTWTSRAATEETAWLADPAQPETLRLLIGGLEEPWQQRDRFQQILGQVSMDRWQWGVSAWIPRPLNAREWYLLREYTAFCLLMDDPTLRTNGLGRQVLVRLRADHAARDAEVRSIVRTAYAEGELVGAGEVLATGRDLAPHTSRLEDVVTLAAGRLLPELFPDFISVAPRRRSGGRAAILPLLQELVLPGHVPVRPGSPMDGLVRDLLLPLGIVAVKDGHYEVCDPPASLLGLVLEGVAEGTAIRWRSLAGALGKSRYGLSSDQVELLIAALVRRGHLVPIGEEGLPISLSRDSIPLSSHAHSLRRGEVLAAGLWTRLERLASALEVTLEASDLDRPGEDAPGSREVQHRIWDRLQSLRETRQTGLLAEQLLALIAEWDGRQDQWPGSLDILRDWERYLALVPENAASVAGLRQFLDSLAPDEEEQIGTLFRGWRSLKQFVLEDGPRLARAFRMLSHPLAVLPPGSDLQRRWDRLQQTIGEGESMVSHTGEVVRYAESLLDRYRSYYVEWHTGAFGESRFAPYRRTASQPGWKALEQLERLPLGIPGVIDSLQALVDAQLARQCSCAGLGGALTRGPVCPTCRLPAGSEIEITPLEQVQGALADAIMASVRALANHSERLEHHLANRLDERSPVRSSLQELLSLIQRPVAELASETTRQALDGLLSDLPIRELRLALQAGEPPLRSVAELQKRLIGRELPRREALSVFALWLDPESQLGPEDYVRIAP